MTLSSLLVTELTPIKRITEKKMMVDKLLRPIYSVFNNSGEEIFQLFGPILHPWTFEIRKNNIKYGKITKKWSGLLKESFTHADNFGVTFPTEWDITQKALFLGAVFLIDFAHFEKKGNN